MMLDIVVLAVHPTSRGYGWVLFEREEPKDWGIASTHCKKNALSLRRFIRLMRKYEPDTLLLEAFEDKATPQDSRAKLLCREIVHLAKAHGIDVKIYPRAMIQSAFAVSGASTRHEIAESVKARLADFAHRMPKKRKPWESADRRQALFDAAAVALTHFALR
jgi:hypothetical protein